MNPETLNLKAVRALVIDADAFGATLTVRMLNGLGVGTVHLASCAAEARKQLGETEYQLCLCESDLPDMAAPDFVKWIRRQPGEMRFLPVLAMTGYGDLHHVTAMRDAGVHLVIRKPASPQVLYDRIAWVCRPTRDFIEAEGYVGPDRRFHNIGPPGGVPRRAGDLSTDVGDAAGPNMSQAEIDSLMRPTKVMAG